jgi:lactate 2-monooxygenase
VRQFLAIYSRPDLSWDDLPALRALTRLRLLLKGILHPDDARRALELGVDGSSSRTTAAARSTARSARSTRCRRSSRRQAGRQCCSTAASAAAPTRSRRSHGVRAVLIGRPYVYGLRIAGEAGVREVFDLTLGLAGCASVAEVTRETLA